MIRAENLQQVVQKQCKLFTSINEWEQVHNKFKKKKEILVLSISI